MTERVLTVVHIDAVDAVQAILNTGLPLINENPLVVSRVPDERPDRFWRVDRAGGEPNTPITDQPRMVIECWSPTEAVGAQDAAIAWAILRSYRNSVVDSYQIGRVDGGSIANFPDPLSHQPRHVLTFTVMVKGYYFNLS